jgi:energy-coupling factor transporter ATP-binding protein EcfA2
MHITRIEVRHWRRHDNLVLDGLSDRINLISGPNEAGKSTIAEALRYALFEPSKPIYDARKSIQQRSGSETPEVDVDFQVEDQRWRIEKRFLRRQLTKLTGPDGRPIEGEDAERKIQELLGFSLPDAGRVTKDVDPRHLGLWPILWLRQGELSGLDGAVTDGVRSKLSELVAREVGSVAAGPMGSRALELVQREYDLFWTGSANKPTGDYAKSIKDREAALVRRDQARSQLQNFDAAVRELQGLTDRLAELTPRRRAADEQAEVARGRARQAAERQRELEQHRSQLGELRRATEDANKLLKQRAKLESDLASSRTDFDKHTGQESGLAVELGRLEQAQLRLEGEAHAAEELAQAAHERAEQARAMAERTALAARVAERTAHLQRIDGMVGEQRRAQAAADAVPDISTRTLNALREKESAYRDACTQRDAAATTIVFQAEQPLAATWTADGEVQKAELQTGGTLDGRTTSLGELHLSGVGTVRIKTGAGEASDLAAAARAAAEALEQALRKLHVTTVEEAQALAQSRTDAVAASRQATIALVAALGIDSKADAEAIASAVDALHREVGAEQARLGAIPELADPGLEPDAARSQARTTREQAETARSAANGVRKEQQAVRDRLASVRADVAVHKDRVQRTSDELARMPVEAEISRHRDEAARLLGDAVNREADLKAAWEALGGAEAANEADAQANVAKRLQDEMQTARQRRDNLLGQLRASADLDPAATLQEAEAELDRLTERATALERQARAVRVLREALLNVQRETRSALAAPVRAAIEPYLRRIFPRATLLLGDDDWRLTGLSAGEADEPFDQLSLGAREQFAMLVRLGLAEVFAQGRRLPLVLDDPLINADPARRGSMIQALRHASRKLQILLFTCHEAEHDTLAADWSTSLPSTR